jgi:LEA14-like dessication related protein
MLTNTYADVYLDSTKIGNINQANPIKVPKESSFDIPLVVMIRTDDKLSLVLKNVMKLFSNKNAVINYKGFIQIKKAGIPIKVPMEDKYIVNLKELKLF